MAWITGMVAGHLSAPASMWRSGNPDDVLMTSPVPVYLIEANGQRVLVDTGLHHGRFHVGQDGANAPD